MKKIILPFVLLIFCSTAQAETYTVKKVKDADSLQLSNIGYVELCGIDAAAASSEKGKEATAYVENLLKGEKVRVEYDALKKEQTKKKRRLVYVFKYNGPIGTHKLQNNPKGHYYMDMDDGSYLFLNATLVSLDYAKPRPIPPNVRYADLFEELHNEVKASGGGMWR